MAASAQSHSPVSTAATTATEASCVAQSCTFFWRATSYPCRAASNVRRGSSGASSQATLLRARSSRPSMPLALQRAIASFRSSIPAPSSPI